METLQLNQYAEYLKPRPAKFHKGDAGRVLVVGGDFGFSGAVRMAAEASLRVGAGLASVATRMEHAFVLNVAIPEIMCHGVGFASEISELMEAASVIVVGPGIGLGGWGRELFDFAIDTDKPLVVDADGLNILAKKKKPLKKSNWILTPHPGEAARLLKISTDDVQANRAHAIKKLHELYGGVIVLKGSGTLVIDDSNIEICEEGNPGMATAGMGDVLSGVIGGLVSQRVPIEDAAKLGVLLHALAGDLAAEEGGERGMIATDLMPFLRRLVNRSES